MMRAVAFCVVSSIMAPLAYADSAAPAWAGVWRGTIGTAAVQGCLQHKDYEDDGAQPCGNTAFSLPRFTPPAITTRPAQLMGVAYTRVQINLV
jgi:hypothetical protein